MDGNFAAEHIARPVSRVIMPKWTAAGPHPAVGVFCPPRLAGINVVLSAYRQRDAISCWHDDAGRPNLDINLVNLPLRERLYFFMAVLVPIRLPQLLFELAVRHAKPALRDRRVRIKRPPKYDFPEVRREDTNDEKQIGTLRRGRDPQFRGNGSCYLRLSAKRRRQKSNAIAKAVICGFRGYLWGDLGRQRLRGWIKIELCPFRTRQRPRRFMTLDEFFTGMPDLQLDLGLFSPAGIFAFEKMTEEPLLQINTIVGVELAPMFQTVDLEPLVLAGSAHKA